MPKYVTQWDLVRDGIIYPPGATLELDKADAAPLLGGVLIEAKPEAVDEAKPEAVDEAKPEADLASKTKAELLELAQALGLSANAGMNKAQIIAIIEAAN
jgi:hypothetical protein